MQIYGWPTIRLLSLVSLLELIAKFYNLFMNLIYYTSI
jgi:hypothetical protein